MIKVLRRGLWISYFTPQNPSMDTCGLVALGGGSEIYRVTLGTNYKSRSTSQKLPPFPILPHPSCTILNNSYQVTFVMSWRGQAQGITGSNNIPLGSRRKFGGSDSTPPADDGYNPSQPLGVSDGNYKRGRSPERCKQNSKMAAHGNLLIHL